MTATLPKVDVPAPEIGRDRRRKEDAHLITGRTRWTDNITLPGMVHLAMLRSPVPAGTITSIDVSPAKDAPGVIGAWAGADFPEQGGLPCAWPITPDMKSPTRNPVAVGTVKHAGEIVAVVAARTKAEAVDAVEMIAVEYSPLPAVVDMNAAVAEGARLVHEDLGTNVNAVWVFDSAGAGTGGDARAVIDAAKNDPDQVVIERTFRQQRLIPAFMEPRSTVVDPTTEQLTIWSATQIPHVMRVLHRPVAGDPGTQDAGDRAGRGRRFRRQTPVDARGSHHHHGGAQDRQARQVHRNPLRVVDLRAPRPGSDPAAAALRPPRRHGHRPGCGPARRHGRLPRHCRAGGAGARGVHVQLDLQVPRRTGSPPPTSSPTRR